MNILSQKVSEQLGMPLDDTELQTALDTIAQIAATKSLPLDSLAPQLPSTLEAQLTEQHSRLLSTLDSLLAVSTCHHITI
jgi:antitoxin component of RelBE/YafQ-DinJ toxin-antitoxin module